MALLVPVAGCVAGTGAIEAEVDADRTQLQPGERVTVTATVENTGIVDLTYDHPGCPPDPIRVWVEGHEGRIGLYPYGEPSAVGTCAIDERSLEPGEGLAVAVHWNGRTEPSPAGPHQGEPVPAGTYEIVAELARADEGPTFTRSTTVTVER